MALVNLGTNTNASLTKSLQFKPGYGSGMSAADIAALALQIKDDQNVAHPVIPGSFSSNGLLFIPNRGTLKMLPGDYVAVDPTTGWPILLSSRAVSAGPWHLS